MGSSKISEKGRLLIEAFESAVKHKLSLADKPRESKNWAEEHYQNRIKGLVEYIANLERKD